GSGAPAIADPRLGCRPRSGAYRIVRWDEPAPAVTGAGDVHTQGAAAVADPRLPAETERGVWVIVSEDGTWHRPLTTYELAVLQGFPTHMPDGRPLELTGKNDARWRERIGNAVPPAAAQAIAETMLRTLMANRMNEWLMAAEDIWVAPLDQAEVTSIVGCSTT
ncbi:MAG TPA: DNA cytosine methyltransferase, partial [Alicyclobacillus sp.]|nr:DNA cytosine methyltransferase [Alicyclobacillus sp.]